MIVKAITTCLLRFATPLHCLPARIPHPTRFLPKSAALFSTDKYHPLVEDLRSIQQEKELEEPLLEMTALNDFNRQAALRIILEKVYEGTLPPRVLIDDKFVVHVRKHPALHFQGIYFRIKEQFAELGNFIGVDNEKGRKIAVKDINECFVVCFDIIRKIPRADALRKEVQLHRRFADYHAEYLFKMIEPAKRDEILTKSRDFYRSSLNKTAALLKQEEERLRKQKELMLELKETQQERDTAIKVIRDGIFQIVEGTAESVFSLLKVQNYLSNPAYRSKSSRRTVSKEEQTGPPPFTFHEGLYDLLPFFRRAVEYYKMVDPELYTSINCLKLKKMAAEMTYFHRISQSKDKPSDQAFELQQKEWQTLERTLEEVYKECGRDLSRICNATAPHSESAALALSMIMISIRLHSIERADLSDEEYKERFVGEVRKIGELVGNEAKRKVISMNLAKISKRVLEVDTDGELGKETRGLKYNRRLKW